MSRARSKVRVVTRRRPAPCWARADAARRAASPAPTIKTDLRRRSPRVRRLGATAGTDGAMEETGEDRIAGVGGSRSGEGGADLAEDLVLADDERLDAGS